VIDDVGSVRVDPVQARQTALQDGETRANEFSQSSAPVTTERPTEPGNQSQLNSNDDEPSGETDTEQSEDLQKEESETVSVEQRILTDRITDAISVREPSGRIDVFA